MNRSTTALVLSLLLIPLMLIGYRVVSLGYPLLPATDEKVLQLSFDARVNDGGAGVEVVIELPSPNKGFAVLEEKITEGALDFALRQEKGNRIGVWSGVSGPDGALIAYRATLVMSPGATPPRAAVPFTGDDIASVRAMKGELSDIRWSLNRQVVSQWGLQYERIVRSGHPLADWSLFRLPQEFQGTFRILLLVPIGALMICILRNVIGFPTFGVFMPVLMALAFRNTGLAYGLGIFAIVLAIGYAARLWIEKLRLLLVPRLSVILTLVIACFVLFALIGNRLDLEEFMSIGLLPFVILTMAIERFFVIVEEEGIREGLRTAAGSAAVAAITYGIIQFEPLQLTFFVYPELLMVVMAAQVLIGRYTGYRLSEFLRFRTIGGGR